MGQLRIWTLFCSRETTVLVTTYKCLILRTLLLNISFQTVHKQLFQALKRVGIICHWNSIYIVLCSCRIFLRNLLYLVIALSVLRFTASDYSFGIKKITFLHLLFLFIFFCYIFFLINMQINILGFIAGKQ